MLSPDQDITDELKVHDQQAAQTHLLSKRKSQKSRHRRKIRDKVLTICCPNSGCQKPIQLLCPYCRLGALHCDEDFFVLSCENCHSTMHNFQCDHCDFPIKASYIKVKQQIYRRLAENADGSKFFAVIFTSLFMISLLWLILSF